MLNTRWSKYGLVAVLLSLYALPGQAAWEIRPEVSLEVGVDDNIQMTANNEEEATIASLEARVQFRQATERSNFDAAVGVRRTEYSGTDLDDQTSPFAQLSVSRNWERFGLGTLVSGRRDSLLRYAQVDLTGNIIPVISGQPTQAELNQGVNIPGDVDRGTFEQDIERTTITATPYLNWYATQRTTVRLGYLYYRYTYDRIGEVFGYRDTDVKGASASIAHDLTERDNIRLSASFNSAEADNNPDTDMEEVTVAWTRKATERTTWSLEAGQRRAEADGGSRDTGLTYRAQIVSTLTQGSIEAWVSRSNWPSGFGDVSELDEAYLSWIHRFAPRWRSRTFANFSRTDSDSNVPSFGDRDYLEVSQEFRYALAEEWSAGIRYQYRWVDRDTLNATADGHGIYLSIAYHPLSEF